MLGLTPHGSGGDPGHRTGREDQESSSRSTRRFRQRCRRSGKLPWLPNRNHPPTHRARPIESGSRPNLHQSLLIDGGIRRGTDIFKALAIGASAVGIGRPYLYGLGTFGSRGVARVVELLRAELATDMGMAGVANLKEIDKSYVRARA